MSLHVETSGHGQDLVLLHGWGMHGGIWGSVRDALATRYRVHVVDLPGYGGSPTCSPYSLDNLADILDQTLPANVNLIAWSMGGLVAQALALARPERVGRVMLVGSSPCFVQRADWGCGIEAGVLEQFGNDLQRDYAATLMRFLSLQVRNGEALRTVLKYLREALFARGIPSMEVLEAGLGILLENDLRPAWKSWRVPLALVHGDRDTLAPAPAARWMAEQVPDAHLRLLSGCAHAPFLSHSTAFLEATSEFFQ